MKLFAMTMVAMVTAAILFFQPPLNWFVSHLFCNYGESCKIFFFNGKEIYLKWSFPQIFIFSLFKKILWFLNQRIFQIDKNPRGKQGLIYISAKF